MVIEEVQRICVHGIVILLQKPKSDHFEAAYTFKIHLLSLFEDSQTLISSPYHALPLSLCE